jgi:trimeric autotransporter adhesin
MTAILKTSVVQNASSSTANITLDASGGVSIGDGVIAAPSTMSLQSNGSTTALYIDTSQNVGIGTTSPSEKLTIAGSANLYQSFRTTGGIVGAIAANDSGSIFKFYTTGSTPVAFGVNNGENMRIDTSGNVGIGQSSITRAYTNYNQLNISGSSGSTIQMQVGSTNTTNIVSDSNGTYLASLSGYIVFSTGGTGTGTERARIDSSGNLLLGTTSVGATLTLTSASSQKMADLYGSNMTDGTPVMSLRKSTNTSTTSQVYVQFLYNNGSTGAGQINGNGGSQAAFGSYSDKKLKENIVDLPPQLANIMALRPVEFDYIESEGGEHQIGFIAQEVQKIYPDVIGEREDGMLTLSGMNKMEARLIKCIQELSAKVDAQAAEITVLKSKVGA